MNNSFEEIEKNAQQLSVAERERLAQRLFESVHNRELTEIDEAWLAVAEERVSAYRKGDEVGLSEAEFFSRLQDEFEWK